MELVSFALLAILIGARHGMDSDHVAAIADMVGSEGNRSKQISLGVMYALGHGLIVFMIGLLTLFVGAKLPKSAQNSVEILVGITLLVLGGFIIYSIFKNRESYEHKGRFTIMYEGLTRLTKKLGFGEKKLSPLKLGVIGAFIIGVIHGVGVESPTQIAAITSAGGLDSATAATAQLVLFVVGLLMSTILMTFLISWGFMKSRLKRQVFIVLGSVTGIYSIILGLSMLAEMIKGGI
ncbi:High-affinity nickel-transporter [Mesobacillus zeae]|uniref:Nickel/cobalt efflux system n=1 Tax=Mesobacillus zeae TaxID=1917180 RepID=A0A398BBW7_9BACI|nr:High-affinity nickel-transporter [Mesobacillus zeae]RID86328.1 High-affinity nickel-transporter [Mesobacillus zeae]